MSRCTRGLYRVEHVTSSCNAANWCARKSLFDSLAKGGNLTLFLQVLCPRGGAAWTEHRYSSTEVQCYFFRHLLPRQHSRCYCSTRYSMKYFFPATLISGAIPRYSFESCRKYQNTNAYLDILQICAQICGAAANPRQLLAGLARKA